MTTLKDILLTWNEDGKLARTLNLTDISPRWDELTLEDWGLGIQGKVNDVILDWTSPYIQSDGATGALNAFLVSTSGTSLYVYKLTELQNDLFRAELLHTYTMNDSSVVTSARIARSRSADYLIAVAWKAQTGTLVGRSEDYGETWGTAIRVGSVITDSSENDNADLGLYLEGENQLVSAPDANGKYGLYLSTDTTSGFSKLSNSEDSESPYPMITGDDDSKLYVATNNDESEGSPRYVVDFDGGYSNYELSTSDTNFPAIMTNITTNDTYQGFDGNGGGTQFIANKFTYISSSDRTFFETKIDGLTGTIERVDADVYFASNSSVFASSSYNGTTFKIVAELVYGSSTLSEVTLWEKTIPGSQSLVTFTFSDDAIWKTAQFNFSPLTFTPVSDYVYVRVKLFVESGSVAVDTGSSNTGEIKLDNIKMYSDASDTPIESGIYSVNTYTSVDTWLELSPTSGHIPTAPYGLTVDASGSDNLELIGTDEINTKWLSSVDAGSNWSDNGSQSYLAMKRAGSDIVAVGNGVVEFSENGGTTFVDKLGNLAQALGTVGKLRGVATPLDMPQRRAYFTVDELKGNDPLTVNFTNQTTPTSDVQSYLWDFGDGSPTSSATNPTHTYNCGFPNVELEVTWTDGTTSRYSQTLEVYDEETAITCLPSSVNDHGVGSNCIDPYSPPTGGDPIRYLDGEKQEQATDLMVQLPNGMLSFTRSYQQTMQPRQEQQSSGDYLYKRLGLGWTHNHHVRVILPPAKDGSTLREMTLLLGNGAEILFKEKVANRDVFYGLSGATSYIEYDDVADIYTLFNNNGTEQVFDSTGKITKQIQVNGHEWVYQYDGNNRLLEVIDDAYDLGSGNKRKLVFRYDADGNLYRVGDHTFDDSWAVVGRYVEFSYINSKLDNNGVLVDDLNHWLLDTVEDIRRQDWQYTYNAIDLIQRNYLLSVVSPELASGVASSRLTLKSLTYTQSGGEITDIEQQLGIADSTPALLTQNLKFQQSGQSPTTVITEEEMGGVTVKHLFNGDIYAGAENAAGEYQARALNSNYRPFRQLDANGNATYMEWSDDGKTLKRVVDAQEHETGFVYDTQDRLVRSVDAEGRRTIYKYESLDAHRSPTLIKVLDQSSQVLRYQIFEYNSNGQVIVEKELDPDNETLILRKTDRTYGTSSEIGLLKQVTVEDVLGSDDQSTTYTYDNVGRVIQVQKSSNFGSCDISYTVYDDAGNVVASICNYDPRLGSAPSDASEAAALYNPSEPNANQVTTHEYDTIGRRISTTTHAGHTTQEKTSRVIYDALNRVVMQIANIQSSGYAAPANWVFDTGVWKDGVGGTVISNGTDLNENIISRTEYNARGMVRFTQDHLGLVTLYGYDDADRLVKTVQAASDADYNNDYIGISPDPDLSDYVISSDVEQDIVTEQVYDAVGNLVKTIDSAGRVSFTVYDVLNRPVKVVQNAKATATIDLNDDDMGYDATLDPQSSSYLISTDPDRDQVSLTDYDALGRMIRSKRLLDKVGTEETWDVMLYGYDALGRQVKTIAHALDADYDIGADPDLSDYVIDPVPDVDIVTESFYNSAGQVAYTRDVLGRETHFAYDGLQRQHLTVGNFKDDTYQVLDNWAWDSVDTQWEDGSNKAIGFGTNNDENLIAKTTYDNNGNGYVQFTRDIDGQIQYFVYDGLGRQILSIANYVLETGVASINLSANWLWNDSLSQWEDTSDNKIEHGANADQNIISETVYDDDGRVEFTRDVQGKVTYFVYDSTNRRVRTIQNYVPQGSSDPADWFWNTVEERWDYDTGLGVDQGTQSDQNLISITSYDVAGRVVITTNTLNNQSYVVYDNLGRRVRSIQNYVSNGEDPALWIWDDVSNRWKMSDDTTAIDHGTANDQNIISDTVYAKDGQVTYIQSHKGNISYPVYDDAGRRIRTIQNYVSNGEDPELWIWDDIDQQWEESNGTAINHGLDYDQNLISDTTYDKAGRVIVTRDSRGTQTALLYDRSGRRSQVIQAVDTVLATTSYTCYDKAGQVLRTISNWLDDGMNPDEKDSNGDWVFNPSTHGKNNDQNLITEYEYDQNNRRIKVTNSSGDVTFTSYFVNGTTDSMTDAEGMVTVYRYDALRRRKRVIQNFVDNGENPIQWVWDDLGKHWEMSNTTLIDHEQDNDQNIIVDLSHDTLGRMTQMRDSRGNRTQYQYDLLNRRTKLINPLDLEWVTTYANVGQAIQTTMTYPGLSSGGAYPVVRGFDRLGRLAEIDYADPDNTPKVQFAYDTYGNRSAMTEVGAASATVRETSYDYDTLGRLKSIGFDIDGDSVVDETVSYQYDVSGNRTQLVLPDASEIAYQYDAKGRLVSITDWDNQATEFKYDQTNRHIATQRQDGFRSRYQYDASGRLKRLRHHKSNETLGLFEYETDQRGNRTQALEVLRTNNTNRVSRTYAYNHADIDFSGTWSDSGSFKVADTWSDSLAVQVYGNEITLTYGTGDDHSIFDVYINQTLYNSYDGYSASNGEKSILVELGYEGLHLVEIKNRHEQNSASSGYKVRFKTLVVEGHEVVMQVIDYTYDEVQRLLSANYDSGDRIHAFSYDLAGNRLEEDLSGTGVTDKFTEYEYNNANQISQMRVDGGSWTGFTYDNNGNLTDDGVNSYTWDRANRLLEVDTGTPAELTAYAYDGLNNRISQAIGTTSPVVTQYLLDTQPALAKVIGATVGGNTEHYIHAPRGIHSVENSSGSWRYALQDGLGSVRAEVDNLGAVQASQSYAPYGEVFSANGSFASPYGFSGEETDGNSQVYLRARYYNPSIGVFNALDPFEGIVGRPMSLNGYSWVEGNPIMNVDPSGLCTMRTLGVAASDEETKLCRWKVDVLSSFYGIKLNAHSGSGTSDDLWTTTRVANVLDAMRAIIKRVGNASDVKQAFGNTTLMAGAVGLSGCASTTGGITNNTIDWGTCTDADDPYTVANIIHEFGHVLQFRNDYYASATPPSNIPITGEYLRPRETWARMLTLTQRQPADGLNFYNDPTSNFCNVQAGFANVGRQNIGDPQFPPCNDDGINEPERNDDEEVADMFLFWIAPNLSFGDSPQGLLRQRFVEGFKEENFASNIPLSSLGMAEWVRQAAQAGTTNVEASASTSTSNISLSSIKPILRGQCLDLPFWDERPFTV